MTVNYKQTVEMIPALINSNKELFFNDIMQSNEYLKKFLEQDSYQKAALNDLTITLEEIKEKKYENVKLVFVTFFDNYINNKSDSKMIVFAINKGILRYFRLDATNILSEIDLDELKEEKIIKFDSFSKERIEKEIIEKLNNEKINVLVGVSNRHVHLTKFDLEKLFGPNFELEFDHELTQKGQYVSKQKVTIKNEFGTFENVRVLGPVRNYSQVEISKTDAYKLKINPPIRDSGDLLNAATVTVVGPYGEINIKGVIIANRHIHLTNNDLDKYGLEKNKLYKIKAKGEKSGILDDVHLKVDDSYSFELHIDTDDANAFLIKSGTKLEIIK